MDGLLRRALGVGAALLMLLVVAGPAVAAMPGGLRMAPSSCWTELGPRVGCQDGRGLLDFFNEVEISPDGRHVYTQGAQSDNVAVYDRAADTGALAHKPGESGCVVDEDWDTDADADSHLSKKEECAEAEGLNDPAGMGLSPDGRQLYVASRLDDSIVVFSRDATTGVLTQAQCIRWVWADASNDCTQTGHGMDGLTSVEVSPDGENVYAVSDAAKSILVFRRDQASGHLTQRPADAGCVRGDGAYEACAVEPAIANPRRLIVTPDHVYVADHGRGVYGFARDRTAGPARGDLTILPKAAGGCLADVAQAGCQAAPALAGDPVDLELGKDGRTLYVVSARGSRINALTRRADGTLAPLACLAETPDAACTTAVPSLGMLHAVTRSPDGSILYVGAFDAFDEARRVTAFDLGADGVPRLRPGIAACTTPEGAAGSCAAAPQLGDVTDLVSSADGRHIYGLGAGRLFGLVTDRPPACEAAAADVVAGASVSITFKCTDADGDPMAYEIVQQAAKGGAHAGEGKLTYTAAANTVGTDTFTYRALAHGGSSDPTTVTVTIAAPGTADPDRDGDGVPASRDCDDGDPQRGPNLPEIPGNAKDENCDQVNAPFPLLKASVAFRTIYRPTFVRIRKLSVRALIGGERITFVCRGRGCPRRAALRPVTVKKAGTFVLTKPFKGRRLLPGAAFTVRVTAAATRGRMTTLLVRKRKRPKITRLCLAPGATKPESCT